MRWQGVSDDILRINMPVHFRFKSVDLLIPAVLLLTAKSVTVTRRAAAVHSLIRRVTNADGLHSISSSVSSGISF